MQRFENSHWPGKWLTIGSMHFAEKRVWQPCGRPATSVFPLASRIYTNHASCLLHLYTGKFRAFQAKGLQLRTHSRVHVAKRHPMAVRRATSGPNQLCIPSARRAHILVSQPAQRPRRYFKQVGFRVHVLGAPIITCVRDAPASIFRGSII